VLEPVKINDFLEKYRHLYATENKISGNALFFTRDLTRIPQYISHIMFKNNIIYENNIFISIVRLDTPLGVESSFTEGPGKRITGF
jgi:KUP system potassium uptake protein